MCKGPAWDEASLNIKGLCPITGGTNVVRERFAMIREDDNFTFIYEPGIDDTDVYPGK